MMKRYLLSLVVLFVGLGWLAVGAPVWGGGSLLQPSTEVDVENPGCNPDDEECWKKVEEAINAPDPEHPLVSPEQEKKAREIILADPVVQHLLSGREEGRDYFLRFDHPALGEDRSAAKQGFVLVGATLYVDPPVDYSGPLPQMTRPCEGHGYEGYVEDDDPCLDVAVEYLTEDVSWKQTYAIVPTVHLGLGKVIDLYRIGMTPDMWPDEVRAQLNVPDMPLASSAQREKAREIILADPFVRQLVSGREAERDYALQIQANLAVDRSAAKQGPVLASGVLFISPPAQYTGPIPQMTNPCEGRGELRYVRDDDPCLAVAVEYITQDVSWTSLYAVRVTVDLGLGKVVDFQVASTSAAILPPQLRPKEAE